MPRRHNNAGMREGRNPGAVVTVEPAPQYATATTVAEALDTHLAALENGAVRSAAGRPYKAAAIEKYGVSPR